MLSVCLCIPPINLWMPEPLFMKLGMRIIVPEPISTAYFINPSHQPVCLDVYPPIVARQWLGKNVTTAMNTHTTIGELLDMSFSVQSVLYWRWAISSSQNFLFFRLVATFKFGTVLCLVHMCVYIYISFVFVFQWTRLLEPYINKIQQIMQHLIASDHVLVALFDHLVLHCSHQGLLWNNSHVSLVTVMDLHL
jgi:hypothetical protein